jgi:hypothetical protein
VFRLVKFEANLIPLEVDVWEELEEAKEMRSIIRKIALGEKRQEKTINITVNAPSVKEADVDKVAARIGTLLQNATYPFT